MTRDLTSELDQLAAAQTGEEVARSDYAETFDREKVGWENGEPVPAGEPDRGTVVELLLEHKIDLATAHEIDSSLYDFITRTAADKSRVMACEVLYQFAVALEGSHFAKTPVGKAFLHVLAPTPGESLTDAAKAVGVSKQTLNYHVATFKKCLDIFTKSESAV